MAVSATPVLSDWIRSYLSQISKDIDVEVCGEYIEGLLQDDTLDKSEILESISGVLESVISVDCANKGSEEIYTRFRVSAAEGGDTNTVETNGASSSFLGGESTQLDDLEQQMRSLMALQQQQRNQLSIGAARMDNSTERDACTMTALRAAGVTNYQANEDDKVALNVALADAEYFAKQSVTDCVLAPSSAGSRRVAKADAFDSLPFVGAGSSQVETEVIDMADLEDALGYGKKDGIKPMSVMDALSTLNPEKFGPTGAAQSREDLKAARSKRLPTPGDVSAANTPAYLLLSSKTYRSAAPSSTVVPPTDNSSSALDASSGDKKGKKKGTSAPSKHLADIGARAEEKHAKMLAKKQEKLGGGGGKQISKRLDDMEAFFISDDDDGENATEDKTPTSSVKVTKNPDILAAGGGNRERVAEVAKQARENASAEFKVRRAKELTERQRQLDAAAKRKTTAQQKVAKQERRRR